MSQFDLLLLIIKDDCPPDRGGSSNRDSLACRTDKRCSIQRDFAGR